MTPQLGIASGRNDNLRLQSTAPIASSFVAWLPEIAIARATPDRRRELRWRSEWTRFARSHADDTLNSEVAASGIDVLDAHTAVAWRAAWQDWHDTLAQPDPDVPATTPDRFRALAAGAVWRHDGGEDGRRLEVEPTLSRKRYLNHRDRTALADADTESIVVRGLVLHDVRRRSGFELRTVRTDYPDDLLALSNTAVRLQWLFQVDPPAEPSSQGFSGSVALGGEHRGFASTRPSYAGSAWDANLRWQQRPDTAWTWGASRGAAEAPGEGADEIVADRVTLSVSHDAARRWTATATATSGHDRYVGSPVARDDDVRGLDLALRHDLSRRWQLALNLGWLHRASQLPALDFTRRLWSVVFTAAL